MIITPTSLTITQLFGSANEQYVIPSYQRRYSWHERQVWELIEDIQLIDDRDTHLLGSIVCLAGHHTAGLNRLELVDGQQRLTTVTIILHCIRQRLERDGENDEAAEVARLLSARALGGKALPKVALDSIDLEDFDRLVKGPMETPPDNQRLASAFGIIRGWIDERSLEQLGAFLYRLKNQAIVIRLDVSEAKDAFKLFETINNRGLKLSPTDIIKNFLLGNAARFGSEALKEARDSWTWLIRHLDGTNPDAFFRYYLMALVGSRITASEVVPKFKHVFMNQVAESAQLPERHLFADQAGPEDDDNEPGQAVDSLEANPSADQPVSFADFLSRLVRHARVYGELVLAKTGDARIDRHLRHLRMIKAVQTYGFLMHLRAGHCPDNRFRDVLKLTESFVLRRHVCRERANETEALFARLSAIDPADPVEGTREAYRGLCPSDEKFREEFASSNYPSNLIDRARYCLERLESARHGIHAELQVLGSTEVHVEHVIPQKIKTKKAKDEFGDWTGYLGTNAELHHPKYVSRIGNLTLFAGALNISASNSPFGMKRQAYEHSSILLTKELASLPEFKFDDVERRSASLADAAVLIWPTP